MIRNTDGEGINLNGIKIIVDGEEGTITGWKKKLKGNNEYTIDFDGKIETIKLNNNQYVWSISGPPPNMYGKFRKSIKTKYRNNSKTQNNKKKKGKSQTKRRNPKNKKKKEKYKNKQTKRRNPKNKTSQNKGKNKT